MLSTTTTTTPRKRRMASVLDAVLESMKMPTPATAEVSGKKIGDTRKVVIFLNFFTYLDFVFRHRIYDSRQ
jgi:hypothetical protein